MNSRFEHSLGIHSDLPTTLTQPSQTPTTADQLSHVKDHALINSIASQDLTAPCSCIELYNPIRQVLVSALKLSQQVLTESTNTLLTALSIEWDGHAGENFRSTIRSEITAISQCHDSLQSELSSLS